MKKIGVSWFMDKLPLWPIKWGLIGGMAFINGILAAGILCIGLVFRPKKTVLALRSLWQEIEERWQ